MPLFIFNDQIPAAPNNPSTDQPRMLQNNQATKGILDVDHFSFNDSEGGLHKRTQFVPTLTKPVASVAREGALYVKDGAVVLTIPGPNNFSTLFYNPDGSLNEYQMTRTIDTEFSKFATNGIYGTQPGGGAQIGGWTFLPGGLLFQYGSYNNTVNTTATIQFPIAFTTLSGPFSIVLELSQSGAGSAAAISVKSQSDTNFVFKSGGGTAVNWMAIGI